MYTLPNLPYQYDALGTYISADIMKLHHTKHHQTYVDKLNAGLDVHSEYKNSSLEELMEQVAELPSDVAKIIRQFGGGHYNHSLFWDMMTPDGKGEPTGDLAAALSEKYGSFQKFVDTFSAQSLNVFGSGWCWLTDDLSIMTTQNQENPLMINGATPLLGLDVWEHAYYLDYKNKRDDYVAAWWNVVDWEYVEARFAQK